MMCLPSGIGTISGAGGPTFDLSHYDTALYTENGTFPRDIPTGVNLSQGFAIFKSRSSAEVAYALLHSGITAAFQYGQITASTPSDATSVTAGSTILTFGSNADASAVFNGGSESMLAWCFAQRVGFMDCVRYAGNGSARTISHNLGVAPKMVIIKVLTRSDHYVVGHQGLTSWAYLLQLSSSGAEASASTVFNSTAPTSSVFSVGTNTLTNRSGDQYVAYLFADDTSASGRSACFSYVGNGTSTGPAVVCGWQPRFVLVKAATNGLSWFGFDTARSPGFVGNDETGPLTAAIPAVGEHIALTADGFRFVTNNAAYNGNGVRYIGLAVR